MKTIRRFFFTMICLCLLVCAASDLLPEAYAASEMKTSDLCINFIKEVEGFSAEPYYDYGQYTVGYGTKCPSEKFFDYLADGIPEKEAEALLRNELAVIEDTLNKKFIDEYDLVLSQHEFDALVSFSYNIGTGWTTYNSTLRNAVLSHANDNDMVYAFGLYCTAGGQYLPGLVTRRLCEANMFLNGKYSKNVSDSFGYVYYDANGGTVTYRVQGYLCEGAPSPAADAVHSTDTFLGWYTDLTGGTKVDVLTHSLSGRTLFARWQSSENGENVPSGSTSVKVTGDIVNIRSGPGTNYSIVSRTYRNSVLAVSHVTHITNMKWGKVQDGWICLDYTNYNDVIGGTDDADDGNKKPTDEDAVPDRHPETNDTGSDHDSSHDHHEHVSGTVRVSDFLRIRSGPGTTYPTVGYLFNGQKVEITNRKTVGSMVWGQIADGWLSLDYIVTEENSGNSPIEDEEQDKLPEQDTESEDETTESDTPAESTSITGQITADVLRIRSAPGTQNSIVGFYYQYEIVVISEKVLANSAYWGKTERGWINLDYFSSDSSGKDSVPEEGKDDDIKTVIADCLRIRKDAGTNHKIVGFLYDGDTVNITQTKTIDGTVWGKVTQGWICMDYVI